MVDVELDYVLPSPDLRAFLTLFYRFHAPAAVHDDVERAQQAQLRFRLSPGAGAYHLPDGSRQDAPAAHLIGPTTGPVRARAEGPLTVFGMGIPPTGWWALVGGDASATRNRVVDATALLGAEGTAAVLALREAGDVAAMAAVAEPLLRRRLRGGHEGALTFCTAVDAWLSGSPSPALDALLDATRLSRRQVERRCNALYGAPPKLLARKYRALRAAVMMASGETGGADGFYDQSHMIREVKQFTGLTPRRLRDAPGALARITIAQRRALVGQVHPIVSET
ncbi:MAG: AraC family transcriptional regulator [Sphingomonas bacterium]|uniref:helix-turn-helix transcriptional regulator n=1 Tax=Sphingomonas bacterium TaxID=1895847 RepID=UPI00261F2580|nr:helix-turn-helix domain-containing protein [Sphingomonas bacterium]MDB5695809.1 AraC family transcriptional regulator [Sphingomonas bacterium]